VAVRVAGHQGDRAAVVLHRRLDVALGGVEHAQVVVGAEVRRVELGAEELGFGLERVAGDPQQHAKVVVEIGPLRVERQRPGIAVGGLRDAAEGQNTLPRLLWKSG
jgi:hypothetical protein